MAHRDSVEVLRETYLHPIIPQMEALSKSKATRFFRGDSPCDTPNGFSILLKILNTIIYSVPHKAG